MTDENSRMGNENSEEHRRFEFNFPIFIVRTKLFMGIFDRLGALRLSRWLSWITLLIVPIVAGTGLYLLFTGLVGLFWNPAAAEAAREAGLGVYTLIPGINPYLPILYGWFAIFCAYGVHEAAHGIAARSLGLRVKSSGLIFLLFVPMGAFVDVDEEEFKKTSSKISSRVLASGVGGNLALATFCLIGVLLIAGGLAPIVDGVYVGNVSEGMPAEVAGLLPRDILVSVDGIMINNSDDLRLLLNSKTSGDLVNVTVARGDEWKRHYSTVVNLTQVDNQTVMGVGLADLMIEQRLTTYQTVTPQTLLFYMMPPALIPGFVPFSDALAPFYESWLGPQWAVYANVLFWIWFINVNVAVFNALPIYPFDGGRMFNIALKKIIRRKDSEKIANALTAAVTGTLVLALLLTIAIPFIL